MSEEWGPWIEHDGGPCPVKGKWVNTALADGRQFEGLTDGGNPETSRWLWANAKKFCWAGCIVAYRVRKPKALQQLIQMVENLPAPSKQYEDA